MKLMINKFQVRSDKLGESLGLDNASVIKCIPELDCGDDFRSKHFGGIHEGFEHPRQGTLDMYLEGVAKIIKYLSRAEQLSVDAVELTVTRLETESNWGRSSWL